MRVLFFLDFLDGVLGFCLAARIRILAAGARQGIQCLFEVFESLGFFAALDHQFAHEEVRVDAP